MQHSSLIVWPATNSFYWYSMAIGGGPEVWLHKVLDVDPSELQEYLDDPAFFREFKYDLLPDVEVNIPLGSVKYNSYIESRGVSEATAKFFKIEVLGEDVIIPLYGNDGSRVGSMIRKHDTDLNYLKYRKIISDKMCGLWNNNFVQQRFDDNVVIFEGAWSVMRWWQVAKENNINIVPMAILSTAVINALPLLYNLHNVTFILDNDEGSGAGTTVYDNIVVHEGINNWSYYQPGIYPDEMNDNQILYMLNTIGIKECNNG